ncbi:MAG TPA: IS110 family transposase [Vicingus sp.]|nr:IS110 family transposase [Vicingus sp.]HRP60430.1 IS110 family transposase [Vicingus sp.]
MKTKFIGIDVSKETLDICILSNNQDSFVIKNNKKEILKFFKSYLDDEIETHVCIENTGKYSWLLMELFPELNCCFYVVNPLHMKISLGLVRGKNDKVDAIRIAQFIKKNHEETTPYIVQRDSIRLIQVLLSERRFRVEQKKQLLTKNKENLVLSNKNLAKKLTIKNDKLIKEFEKQIKDIELEIKELVKQDQLLNKQYNQLKSIPGVGDILCWNMIVKTNEFKSISEPRKLACYSGVAPFSNSSGTSVFGRNRVSVFADKGLKRLLHMAAMRTIQMENDFSIYYQRKVSEGKNKMSFLNAVRNKIIHVIFALIKNQNFYQNRLVLS